MYRSRTDSDREIPLLCETWDGENLEIDWLNSLEQIELRSHKNFEDNLGNKMLSNFIRLGTSIIHLRAGDSTDFACHGSSTNYHPRSLPLANPTQPFKISLHSSCSRRTPTKSFL